MNRLSASAVPRALACPASMVLPQQDYRTTYAESGTDRHAEMEDAAERGDLDSLPDAVRKLIRPGDQMATEITFAYDVATGEGRHLSDRRDARPFEMTGTIDLLIAGNGRIVVVDYKSFEAVAEAEINAQLATYALMVARTYGYRTVTVTIVYLVANRRPSIFELEAMDLDAHAARLRGLHVEVARVARLHAAGESVPTTTGTHCKYCPAFLACPAQKVLLTEVSSGVVALRVESTMPLADDRAAADAYVTLVQLKTLTQRLTAAVYARAQENPIPLANGKLFGPRETKGNEKIDGDIAYEVVRAKHGQAIADVAVERKATKTKLREALGFAAAKGKVAAAERDVLEAIRERGGIDRGTKTVFEEYDAQSALKLIG